MGSGGGGGSTPKLIDDNLKSKQFLRVLDLISEGPIYGPVDQMHLSSFMLNKTPVTDAQGNASINGVSVAWRPGTATQSPINGFSAIEATTIVNADVTQNTPLVRTVTDSDVTRVRMNIGVSGLMEQDTKGNQKNTSVTMVIELRTGNSAWQTAKSVTIKGKISGEYLEAHLIDAPETKPFDIRLRRVTADSSSDLLTNGTVWNSYTEITDDNLSYPYAAIAGAVIDRDQYTDTPTRTYHLRGLIVDVPDNYDPIARSYAGIWTGGFKSAWTNNPAWIFRALVKNTRYGLAKRAGYIDVDDGSLYVLSQFCDQLVDDGYGGQEPRFTLNAYITEQKSARDILDSIAGMFRGIALWDGMRFSIMLDNPQDPVTAVTNANVVDGLFTYSSMKRSDRYNAVVVSWTDPNNGWEQVKEYVSDDEMIDRYGYNETTLEAFGCTSRGQAFRAGKWLIESAKRETKKVTFRMARDAIGFIPGDIIEVMDNNYAATRLGGRIASHSGAVITVDADVSDVVGGGDTMSLMGADGKFSKFTIGSVAGRVITLRTSPAWIKDGTIFVISTGEVATRLFRVMGVSEDDNNSVYSISATLYDPHKQAIVDEGAVFEMPTDTLNGYRVPNIENLRIINTNSETVQVTATWETATTTRKLMFELYVYNGSGAVVAQYETDQFRYEFYGLNAGSYTLGVRGRNENGMKGAETQVSLVIGEPSAPSSVQWTPGIFSADIVPVMNVTSTTDTSFEFWYTGESAAASPGNIETQAQFLGRASQWTLHALKADTTYYMYVRTKNAFGVSAFVEVSGQASSDIPGMLDYIDEAIRNSDEFENLTSEIKSTQTDVDTLNTAVDQAQKDISSVRTEVDKNQQAVAGVSAAISSEQKARVDGDNALSQQYTDLSSKTDDNAARLTTVEQTVTDNQTSTAQRLSSLDTKTDANAANITAEQKARTDADAALSQNISNVKATTDANTSSIGTLQTAQTSTSDAIANLTQNTEANFDSSALAAIENALANDMADQSQRNAIGQARARITTVEKTQADANGAFSEYQQTVAAQLNQTNAAVQQTSTAVATIDGKLSAQWGVSVQTEVNGTVRIAGIQLGISGEGGKSNFLISADTFAVYNPTSGGQELVFATSNGQMFMRSAFIQDGSIDNAKIGNYIQSNNYAEGSTGWAINKNGAAQFNQVTVRGTMYANAGEMNNVTINENCVIKGTLSAKQINGPLMQGNSFTFGHSKTGATSTVYWDGTAGRGDINMTAHGFIDITSNASTTVIITAFGNEVFNGFVPTGTTSLTFRFDVGTAGGTVVLRTPAINQGQNQSVGFRMMVFASPTANNWHE